MRPIQVTPVVWTLNTLATSGLFLRSAHGKTVAINGVVMVKFKTFSSVALLVMTLAAPAYAQHRGGASRGTAVARGGGSRGVVVSPGRAQARSYPVYRGGVVVARPGYYRPYYGYRPYYAQPYYAFRPRVSIGFGLWAGYPVPYSYGYAYPYGYPYPYSAYPYAYGYPAPSAGYPAPYPPDGQSSVYPSNQPPAQYPNQAPEYSQPEASVGVQPNGQSAATGGVSFDVTPDTAEVVVDGSVVGTAGSFGPRNQPLGLAPGRHRVEIRAPGYRTMTFDADVQAGQVIPYQGQLPRN
jgi:hypothetical protein